MELYTYKKNLIPYISKDPKISIIGIPFDSTSIEYPGSRFGPGAIRDVFSRFYGHDRASNVNIYSEIEDLGDIDVAVGSTQITGNIITKFISRFKEERETTPIFLGGEHSISYHTIKALSEYEDFDVIVFDAHTDFFDSYAGESLSHISYLKKLSEEGILNYACIIGAREYTQDEEEDLLSQGVDFYPPEAIDEDTILKDTKDKVYLSIDMDVLDYFLAIGTGTPEYGGLMLEELVGVIEKIIENKTVIGIDICETNPTLDGSRVTTYSAAILLKKIIIALTKD